MMLGVLGMAVSLFGLPSMPVTCKGFGTLSTLLGVLGIAVSFGIVGVSETLVGLVSNVFCTDVMRGGGGIGRSATAVRMTSEQLGDGATRLFLRIHIKKIEM